MNGFFSDSVNFVEKEAVVLATGLTEVAAGLLMPPPPLADSPTWAHRLRDCEVCLLFSVQT